MAKDWITNRKELETTDLRAKAFEVLNAGYDAIETSKVVKEGVNLRDGILSISGKDFKLDDFKNVYIIGVGKASCRAALTLEEVLGDKIHSGAVIDRKTVTCQYVTTFEGTHPKPSSKNVEAAEHIVKLSQSVSERDLVLVVVSGGGSALLCWPESECEQGIKLYDTSLTTDWTIHELNTVRKHISSIKGGGLAKLLYPATVVGLIFCDVPGDSYTDVASGPTYLDESSVEDAVKILKRYNLEKEFELGETPKDQKFFEKVINIPLVSNGHALKAMADKAKDLGFETFTIPEPIYDFTEQAVEKIFKYAESNMAVLGGGETRVKWPSGQHKKGGHGGRNLYLTLSAFGTVGEDQIFISIASDGMDNSDAAGGVADMDTLKRAKEFRIDFEEYKKNNAAYAFFEKTGDLIFTGPTEANVSDLYLLLTK